MQMETVKTSKGLKKKSENSSKHTASHLSNSYSTEDAKTEKNTMATPSYHGEATKTGRDSSIDVSLTEHSSTESDQHAAKGVTSLKRRVTPINVKHAAAKSTKLWSRTAITSTISENTLSEEKQRKKNAILTKRKIQFEDALSDTETTKKKKDATSATKKNAQTISLEIDELERAYENEMEMDLRIEREIRKEKMQELMKQMRDDRVRQHEWAKRNEKASNLWQKLRKDYTEKEIGIQNGVYKDGNNVLRCQDCWMKCNVQGIHWNYHTKAYAIVECEASRDEQESQSSEDETSTTRKQTLTLTVEDSDGEEIDDTDNIFNFDYSPQLLLVIRGFVQHILYN